MVALGLIDLQRNMYRTDRESVLNNSGICVHKPRSFMILSPTKITYYCTDKGVEDDKFGVVSSLEKRETPAGKKT